MNIAIIGCGLIGHKRAAALGTCRLLACADIFFEKAQHLAQQFPGCQAYTDWQAVIARPDIDIVIIATLHASLADIAFAALSKGKHVLLEKPGGCRKQDLVPLLQFNQPLLRIGYNHRYHRTFRKARALIDEGVLGDLMFIRGRYGHGGRKNYDKEWRAQPSLSGGGELIDQGVHLIDLARWFLGDFSDIHGHAQTYYWDMPVDDNSFLTLKTPQKQIAFLHASCTEWRNLFSFEIFGKKGKIAIKGLGGSYGVERITFYQMREEMGPPETFMWEYPMADDSFQYEFNEFLEDIRLQRQPQPGVADAHATLHIVEEIYRMSNL